MIQIRIATQIHVKKWPFFTTNYDNTLEEYWVKHRKYSSLDLGFAAPPGYYRKIMLAEEFVQSNRRTNYGAMQLIKLHGSINWIRNNQNEIEEHELNSNLDEVAAKSGTGDYLGDIMIYPLTQKQLYFTPFIQLFRILGAELNDREIWIIIGYSFRDIIIRSMFEKSLTEKATRRIILVHPHGDEIRELFAKNLRSQILCLNYYFAKSNYMSVNKKIAQSLLK